MEHVVGVRRGASSTVLRDALGLFRDVGGERQQDYGECVGAVETLVALRDELGAGDVVLYHVCNHDQGVGICVPTEL